ncbi:MAG: hypothetical protein FWG72_02595 [Oscillospiraceae bacterium]|nr:hypothetical protein [Oscillospiraceae bacterium]
MDESFGFPDETGFGEQERASVLELGAVTAQGAKTAIHCLTIVGQVVITDSDYTRQ